MLCFGMAFCGASLVCAQEQKENTIKVQKRTLMDKFESDYVLPVSERKALKENRISYQRNTKQILDTLDLSDRKRKKLIRELKRNPFSLKIKETITADVKIQEIPTNKK